MHHSNDEGTKAGGGLSNFPDIVGLVSVANEQNGSDLA
jgi:hypothetical protein